MYRKTLLNRSAYRRVFHGSQLPEILIFCAVSGGLALLLAGASLLLRDVL